MASNIKKSADFDEQNLEATDSEGGSFQPKAFCPKHEDQILTFYCDPCQTLVCVSCTVVEHRPGVKHNPVEISSIAVKKKEELQKQIAKVKPREKFVRAALNEVKMGLSELSTSADTAIEQATAYFDHLMAMLQDRKEEVVTEIESRRKEAGKYMETQIEAIEFELAGLKSAAEFCKQSLEHGSDVHVIEAEGQARQRVEELLAMPTDLTAGPSQVVFSEGMAVADFKDDVARAGCVHVQHTGRVDASKCVVKRKPAVVAFSSIALLYTIGKNGHRCSVDKDDVTATLTDPLGQAIPTQLQETGMGLWEISYTPEVTGNHKLEVKVNGRSLTMYPYDVRVQSSHAPVVTIGTWGLCNPTDIAVSINGEIAVVEAGLRRIKTFNTNGDSCRCFLVDGKCPWGIDIDSNRQFVVTFLSTGQAIRVYSHDTILFKTLRLDCLRNPTGVAVLKDGRMVVADKQQKSCLLLKPDGSFIREIGKGQLQYPWFIAVDESRDRFYVTDCRAHKVFVFDLEGKLKFSFGKQGQNEGELECPTGIRVDPAGNIIVINRDNGHLQVFDPDGTYQRTVATVKRGCHQGIALTPDGYLAVVCSHRQWGCIELYRYK
ncbi:tripartite motif-containing protein 3-like [Branchiostoma floridae x Branchiostoma japonicum]